MRTERFCRHKSHINKVMAVCMVGYAFHGTPDDGGTGVRIGFTRAQASRIAKRTQRKRVYSKDGSWTNSGPIVRRKGEAYSVDVAVTGSNNGNSSDPKFTLLQWFEDLIFKEIEKLVGEGGRFEGYTPVIQGDNAGPHVEKTFKTRIESYCNERGWLWEPQSSQMPQMNVCDLAIFPAMSKRHTHTVGKSCKSMASPDVIWNCANNVWSSLEEVNIAKASILVWRLAALLVKKGGDNKFFGTNDMHVGISQDFVQMFNGLRPKIISAFLLNNLETRNI